MSMPQELDLYALVDETNADEAYLASLSALYDSAALKRVSAHRYESDIYRSIDVDVAGSSLEEVLAVRRTELHRGYAGTRIPFLTRSQKWILDVILTIGPVRNGDASRGRLLSVQDTDILPTTLHIPEPYDELSIPVGAALSGLVWQEHLDRIFLALCAPDAHSRVKMGVYNILDKLYGIDLVNGIGSIGWNAAVEMAATYHGNHEVARDLACSWFHLHEHRAADSYVHLSLDEMIMQVEAAPKGSSVGVSSRLDHVAKHGLDELNASSLVVEERTPLNYVSARPRYPEDDGLTREQVLATLQTPSETLLQALEAVAARPDPEWIEAEKQALELLAALAALKDWESVGLQSHDGYEQRCFLEQHGPYQVRRLRNGGVMLNAYPYGYLWPLWARALDLLGIRKLMR
jgi:hypothetical protein